MKTKVAMAISLAGVLAAGTAAALVNTRVLNGGSDSALSAEAPLAQQTTPGVVVSPVSTPAVTVPAAGVVTSPSQATYAIGDSGTVTLDTASDVLTIAAVTPAAGWTVTQSEMGDGSNAEVKFQAGNVEVEFQANLLYGVVRTSVESHDLSSTNGTVGGISGSDDEQSGQDARRGGDDDDEDGGDD